MLVEVYHAMHRDIRFECNPDRWYNRSPEDYQKVALVNVERISQVYEVTNHIDHDWQTNPQVVSSIRPARSTSVGDVYIVPETREQYMVDSISLRKLEVK